MRQISGIAMTPLVGTPATWLCNTLKMDAADQADSLRVGHANRRISVGYPNATDLYTADELDRMGMVGLYDCTPASDPKTAGSTRPADVSASQAAGTGHG